MGFGLTWRKWTSGYLSSAHFSVFINGKAYGYFHASRDLCQGEPFLHFLFTLVIEAFSKMLQGLVDSGIVQVLLAWPNGIILSHLQYADDTLILLKGKDDNIHKIWLFLKLYELISRARINMGKSKALAVTASRQNCGLGFVVGL
ncbi:uncharacterized protein LOC105420912 [Amborella trichopoda]|uniref:uncharacterized protein LOC105420912 n=1 Tax=Amborella trichopoda TaxID=13333 RepID=UPI0005D3A919|nr:uncharacterized protein LOC105420912 [Amborella trichopoda]|eukprot:XP_011624586.1 uncharacterized protein LOC105420912 [Amborella trichopoda]